VARIEHKSGHNSKKVSF